MGGVVEIQGHQSAMVRPDLCSVGVHCLRVLHASLRELMLVTARLPGCSHRRWAGWGCTISAAASLTVQSWL
jgi:hypothetical protein